MDDTVDLIYRRYLLEIITPSLEEEQRKSNTGDLLPTCNTNNPRCCISALLILRYLERISDHACHIGDSVHYIVTGVSTRRR